MLIDLEEDRCIQLIVAIIRQAHADHRASYRAPDLPDATTFLHAAGLLAADGSLAPPDPDSSMEEPSYDRTT